MLTDILSIELSAKTRALLDAQYTIIMVVLLICAAIGGAVVFTTYVAPESQTEQRTTGSLSLNSEYTHSATVTEPNPIYPVGTELENRTTYFTAAAPQLSVQLYSLYRGENVSDVTIEQQSTLVIQQVDESGVLWDRTDTLGGSEATAVSEGERVTTPIEFDVRTVAERIASIEEALGASPGETEVFVRTDIIVSGVIAGERVTETTEIQLNIDLASGSYTVSNPGVTSETIEQTEPVTVEQSAGPIRRIGGPLLLLGGLLGAAVLWAERRRGTFVTTETEQEYLDYQADRDEFDDWITRMQLPDSAFDRPTAKAESLADLVDFAIDNNTSVVEDPDETVFYVVGDGSLYTYRPPSPPSSAE